MHWEHTKLLFILYFLFCLLQSFKIFIFLMRSSIVTFYLTNGLLLYLLFICSQCTLICLFGQIQIAKQTIFNSNSIALVYAIPIALHTPKIKAINTFFLSFTSIRQSHIRLNLVATVISIIFVLF